MPPACNRFRVPRRLVSQLSRWIAGALLYGLCTVLGGGAVAGYEEGLQAFDSGDFAAAYREWLPLAEAGDPRAQHGLGLLYETGSGVEKRSYSEALKWYRLAAAQGLPAAISNIALMYAEGRGVPQDLEQAASLWEQAAAAGLPMAQFNLGLMYFGGRGVDPDDRLAARWFAEAAAQGLADAQFAIGEMYRLGRGVDKDLDEARRWFAMAAAAGYPAAAERLAALGGPLPPEAEAARQAAPDTSTAQPQVAAAPQAAEPAGEQAAPPPPSTEAEQPTGTGAGLSGTDGASSEPAEPAVVEQPAPQEPPSEPEQVSQQAALEPAPLGERASDTVVVPPEPSEPAPGASPAPASESTAEPSGTPGPSALSQEHAVAENPPSVPGELPPQSDSLEGAARGPEQSEERDLVAGPADADQQQDDRREGAPAEPGQQGIAMTPAAVGDQQQGNLEEEVAGEPETEDVTTAPTRAEDTTAIPGSAEPAPPMADAMETEASGTAGQPAVPIDAIEKEEESVRSDLAASGQPHIPPPVPDEEPAGAAGDGQAAASSMEPDMRPHSEGSDDMAVSAEGEMRAAEPTVVAPKPDRIYRIWLTELENADEAAAAAEWRRLLEAYPDLLGGREPLLRRVERSDGVRYRIQAGPFANRTGAEALCALIQQRKPNEHCMVVLN